MKKKLKDVIEFINGTADEHMGAFAAQTAFFIFLSFFPLINIAAALPTYLPIKEEQIISVIYYLLPANFEDYVAGIVHDMYTNKSDSITIFSLVVAIWSAAKGIMAMRNGLNEVYRSREARNYLLIRGISSIYTIVFILLLIILVPLNMFGTQIAMGIIKRIPGSYLVTILAYNLKSVATFLLLFIMFELLYTIVPTRKLKFRNQLPGAVFSALSWIVITRLFAFYVDHYASKSYMYGSITTIIMLMIWLDLVMIMLFWGAQLNEYIQSKKENDKEYELSKYSEEKSEVWDDDEISEKAEEIDSVPDEASPAVIKEEAEVKEDWEDDDIVVN